MTDLHKLSGKLIFGGRVEKEVGLAVEVELKNEVRLSIDQPSTADVLILKTRSCRT